MRLHRLPMTIIQVQTNQNDSEVHENEVCDVFYDFTKL